MNRIYKQAKTDKAKYFVATEVEHTPLYGMTTLFVVGVHPVEEIVQLARANACPAVYFGTGASFTPNNDIDLWDQMICQTIDNDLWATLDFDVRYTDLVQGMRCASNRRFVPMISVKIPRVMALNYNATLKIDDIDFDSTNPGVWCWQISDLTQRDCFSDWEKYRNDTIIEEI